MIKWQRYFARKFSAYRFEVVMRCLSSDFFRREFGLTNRRLLIIPERGNHAMYFVAREWEHFARVVFRGWTASPAVFRKYVRLITRDELAYANFGLKLNPASLRRLTWPQLLRVWREFDRRHLSFFETAIWIPFTSEPLFAREADRVVTRLAQRQGLSSRVPEYLDILLGQEHLNAINNNQLSLTKIALSVKQRGRRSLVPLLKRHTRTFGFIPCYDIIDSPWTEADFQKDVMPLLKLSEGELKREITKLQDRPRQVRRAYRQLIKMLRPNRVERNFMDMVHEFSFIKDERDDYRRLGSFRARPLMAELDRRLGYMERGSMYLAYDELDNLRTTAEAPPVRVVRERMKSYVIITTDGKARSIYSGPAAVEILARALPKKKKNQAIRISGTTGNRGRVTGTVALVITHHDLRRVRRGDILVAVTTHPDFVPAMRRARAFVTDEGGITSHAAIVSRELGIPSVVGTKHATHLLKDGDRVEVDATKGTVRKL